MDLSVGHHLRQGSGHLGWFMLICPRYLGTGGWSCGGRELAQRKDSLFFFNDTNIYFFFFWGHAACRILVPRPGIEPMPLAVKAQSPNHWTAREVQDSLSCQIIDQRETKHAEDKEEMSKGS